MKAIDVINLLEGKKKRPLYVGDGVLIGKIDPETRIADVYVAKVYSHDDCDVDNDLVWTLFEKLVAEKPPIHIVKAELNKLYPKILKSANEWIIGQNDGWSFYVLLYDTRTTEKKRFKSEYLEKGFGGVYVVGSYHEELDALLGDWGAPAEDI